MSELTLPYAAHPAFRAEGPPLPLDEEAARAFSDAYARLERGAPPHEQPALAAVAREAFARLCDRLAREAPDRDLALFVSELAGSAAAVLEADLAHFARARAALRTASDEEARWLGELEARRFFLERLSPAAVRAIQALARPLVERLRENARRGLTRRDELSVNGGWTCFRIVRALNREFSRRGILRTVSAYAAAPMEVVGVAVELSVARADWWRDRYRLARAPHTLYVHTDASLASPKAIVYLTDTDRAHGATSVFPRTLERLALTPLERVIGRAVGDVGSAPSSPLHDLYRKSYHQGFSSEAFRGHFARLPAAMQYNSHFGWDVLPDSELERALVDAELRVEGPAGSFLVFDGGDLLHRGGLVEEGERLALQVVFGPPRSFLALLRAYALRLWKARA